MMNGFGMFMMSAWIPLVILFWVIVIAAAIWLVMRALHQRRSSAPLYTPPSERVDQPYEQGYQPRRSTTAPSPKSEEQVLYSQPEDEQPRAHYPQSQELPPQ